MDDFRGIVYSQDDTVRAIRDYYAFLVKMYMHQSIIVEPPPEGWPSITPDAFREGPPAEGQPAQVAPRTPFLNYEQDAPHSTQEGKVLRLVSEGELEGEVPPHVVGLTGGEDEPYVFLLDTKLGVIYWNQCPAEIEHNLDDDPSFIAPVWNDSYSWAPGREQEWRGNPCWPVRQFFEVLKQQFLTLNYVPLTEWMVVTDSHGNHPRKAAVIPLARDVYREFGWPDLENFRKGECQAALTNLLKEHDVMY